MKHYKPSGGKTKKRLLALVLAAALGCSSLMPVYANDVATMDAGFEMDSGFGVDVQLDDDFGVDMQIDDDFGVSAQNEDEGADLDLATGVTEVIDADGNIVYVWGEDTYIDWTGDDAIVSPYPDGEEMDPGFAIPTVTYRFWLSQKDKTELAAFNAEVESGVKLYGMTKAEYIDLYGPNDGMFSAIHVADGGSLWDNSFKNPTASDAPDAGKNVFAGWYTLDEHGYEQKFTFDADCKEEHVSNGIVYASKMATVDVFAKWSTAVTDQVEQPKTNPNDDATLDDHTYNKWYAALVSSSDSAFNDLIDRYLEDEGFEAWLADLSDEELQPLSDRMDSFAMVLDERYTIAQGGSQSINLGVRNLQSVTKINCDPNPTSGSISVSKEGNTIKVSVNKNVPVGMYALTVKIKYGGYPTTETEVVLNINVIKATGTYNYSQEKYDGDEPVAWDVVGGYDRNGNPNQGMNNAGNYIRSVKMMDKEVTWGESDHDYRWSTYQSDRVGQKLSSYFGTDVTKNTASKSITLTIEPQSGYYVTGYWIVCCNGAKPYSCAVMSDGNEHHAAFEFADTTGGAVQDTVWSEYFAHPGTGDNHNWPPDDQYFILISVAPVPTPLFVEYDYGEIKDHVSASEKAIFTSPTSWTTTDSRNDYGNGKVDTQNTQYRYAYTANRPMESENWRHYANAVTDEARQAAANAGYYFAGWKAEYYTDAKAKAADNDSDGKNYNYNFSNHYSAERTYNPGDKVNLLMHVKLIAQWKPIQLKVTKTVDGLAEIDEHTSAERTYKLKIQKLNADNVTYTDLGTYDYTLTGDGTLSYVFEAKDTGGTYTSKQLVITPGTYKVVETGNYDLTGSTENAYCTTTYPVETVVVAADGKVKELKVLNTYSSTPAGTDVTVKKMVTGLIGDPDKDFNFKVAFTNADGSSIDTTNITAIKTKKGGSRETLTNWSNGFTLKHNEHVTFSLVPLGTNITVTETNADGYDVRSSIADSPEYLAADRAADTKVEFTQSVTENLTVTVTNHKTLIPDAGVDLGSATPYLFLLCVGAVGVATLRRKRRS